MDFALDVFSVASVPKTTVDDVKLDIEITSKPTIPNSVKYIKDIRVVYGKYITEAPRNRIRGHDGGVEESEGDDINCRFGGR